jgi:hypothetical protein
MDGSREQPVMTAGLDLDDKYSYLCLIDTQSGEIMEEGRLHTTPEALRRRFCSERPLRIAIETGTHSPWVSRVLEECDHEGIKAAVAGELPGTEWQRCAVHFQRNVLGGGRPPPCPRSQRTFQRSSRSGERRRPRCW